MKRNTAIVTIKGIIGFSGGRKVFLAFSPASLLHGLSFADVLNEDTGEGYQRPHNKKHSLDFKKYITNKGSSTVPLTFNLRKDLKRFWKIEEQMDGCALLTLKRNSKCLARVDCQHRLGELKESDVPLAFMSFIGLNLREEMSMFVVINSKAKGLSSSLTDYHESNLNDDLINDAPHFYIARKLNEEETSPWFMLIRYGGETTSGLKRRTSFRMMQKAVALVLKDLKKFNLGGIDCIYDMIEAYWNAVRKVFPSEWKFHRKNLITKGVGMYSLMMLLKDIVSSGDSAVFTEEYFEQKLKPLKAKVDWDSNGTFATAGGQKGAKEVYLKLKGFLK